MNAGVMGLNVNATKLSTISDNIANSSTYGYKRVDADFSSIVLANSGSSYESGGVNAVAVRDVEASGSIISTGNALDISIAGRGMMPVTAASTVNSPAGDRPFMLTPTGQFRPDDEGYLVTSSGLALLGWPVAADGTVSVGSRDSALGLQPVNTNPFILGTSPTTFVKVGLNLPATQTDSVVNPLSTAETFSTDYYDTLGAANQLDFTFTPITASPASYQWQMTVDDAASAVNPIGDYTITFAADGTLSTVANTTGGAFDPTTGLATITTASGALDLDLGIPGDPTLAVMTQYSDGFAPTGVIKDGSPVGILTSVEINDTGMIEVLYDTGFRRPIFQVPVGNVSNPNGLTAVSAQAYELSANSGPLYLWDAGDGPVGETSGYSLNQSTVDIAAELTDLISTQRAYSSNARIITTVDEMLQETTNLKR